jgi:diaminohydroxyphosphoribosylaminopyrimidine deaminase/5-amino-6-(5-phosphoribosylamino)uracil reductase
LSADGKLSANDGTSKWITGEEARMAVHQLRSEVDAVIVGIETIFKDNPHLTCRLPEGKNPKRIIVDSTLKIPYDANVFDKEAETIIATTHNAPINRITALRTRGIRVIVIDGKGAKVDLKMLLKELAAEEITSIMIEGGGKLIGSAFDAKIVDKVMLFIAPKIIGGSGTTISGQGICSINESIQLEKVEMKQIGEDFLLVGYPKK